MVDKPIALAWRDMAYVPRWVILRRHRQQSLAEHSYFVAVYAKQIAELIGYKDIKEVMWYALIHDIDETITGDIPGPIKRAAFDKKKAEEAMHDVMMHKFGADVLTDLKFTYNEVRRIVSAADSVEEVCFLMEEMSMGNKDWIKPVADEAVERLKHRWAALPAERDVLKDAWNKISPQVIGGQLEAPVLLRDLL